MKVSKNWLKKLVELKIPLEEVERLLPVRTIAIKQFTPDYFELDMKGYNRADLLSLRGVAYEIAAIADSTVKFSESDEPEYLWNNIPLEKIPVEIKNTDLCPFYAVAKIEGLKTESSPKGWVDKLTDSGMRSVNNIADLTNLIMLEYGQPMHAFDASKISSETIVVRSAKNGEQITTLDNKVRELTSTDLLIADPKKAVGIAGVMGGQNSEVTEKTNSILLEAAIFNPINLRQTAARLNLYSEAGKRFQHGLTKKRLLQALDQALRMYQKLGGKVVGITLAGNMKDHSPEIELNLDKLNNLIGIKISGEFIEKTLSKLYFNVKRLKEGRWKVIPPYFRLDINFEEDVIEEIARIYGYEKIPAQPLDNRLPAPIDQKLFHLIYDIKKKLCSLGLTEVQTYSFYPTSILENFTIKKENLIRIGNPISSETEYMRDQIWPNLVKVASDNLKQRGDLAVFEIGKVYLPKEGGLPNEEYKLSLALSSQTTESIQEIYAVFLRLAEDLNFEYKVKGEDGGEWFHPIRFVKIFHQGREVGFLAEVHPKILDKFGTGKRVAVAEINLRDFL